MRLPQLLLVILLSVGAALATVFVADKHQDTQTSAATHESAYDRVLRTGTLRCGYFEEAPFTIIDPNTGAKSGIAVELAGKIAAELGLKLEWVGGFNFGTVTEDLKNGRFDAVCASFFTLPRAGRSDYTIPYTYVPVYGFTQAGRTEFDNRLDQLDWSKVTVAGIDGEGSTTVVQKKLPQTKFTLLPQNAQIADMLTSMADKKADMAFVMPTVFANFQKSNPGKLQKIATDKPFYVFNVSFGVKPDEPALKNMLDFTIRSLETNGYLNDLFQKYDPDGLLFRPADLYRDASKP